MSRKSDRKEAEFVFVPLGGVGEIGMNLYLYGYGREGAREWLIVDMGVTFGGDFEPGIDVILPDIRFLEEERHNIAGLLLTHAHEDHFGAVADLWPQLGGVPVYATPFTAEMLKSKLAETGRADGLPLHIMPMGGRRTIGPFDVELVSMSHSIPEPSAVIIRTPLGAALHTGDWKLDENPLTSAPTDQARLRALGDEGLAALICDSTNAVRDGISPSEADVAVTLNRLIREAPWFDDMIVKGHRPQLAVLVEIEQIFFHCMKALMRSRLWEPESWNPGAVPPHAQIVKSVQPCEETLEDLERHYGPQYESLLYG